MRRGYGVRDDVDEVAVERACAGDRAVQLNAGELAAAFRELNEAGLSSHAIAERLGVVLRTVFRWKAGQSRPTYRGRAA